MAADAAKYAEFQKRADEAETLLATLDERMRQMEAERKFQGRKCVCGVCKFA